MNEQFFHDLVSGRRRGVFATTARGVLAAGQLPYAAAVAYRNWRYDSKPGAVTRVQVPVVSIGNITVGGTGKTPMVKWVARQMRAMDLRVAILSRGYGAEEGAVNDEAIELEEALPDVPHLQDPDRVASAQIAIEELESETLLLDDGFQHRRLARDLDIVLLDGTCPFGHNHLLPRGLLREPLRALRRADVVCLTRADQTPERVRQEVVTQTRRVAPHAIWCEASHQPQHLVSAEGQTAPLSQLSGRTVLAFCGIGNPSAFAKSLEDAGAKVLTWRTFPDHHPYRRAEIDSLTRDAQAADLAICTHKDLAKIQATVLGDTPLWALEVDMQFRAGEAQLRQRLQSLYDRPGDPPTDAG